jgi:UDP-N-acetylmuramate dehydrogenase
MRTTTVAAKHDLPSKAAERGLADHLLLDEPLSEHTSYRIGGSADFFAVAENCEHLSAWVALARDLRQPFLVIGRGTNLLVADRGYRGLIIENRCLTYAVEESSHTVFAEAGVSLARLARQTAETGLGGLEWAVGIPGTVGGAIVSNAGAYGGDMAATLGGVSILDQLGHVSDLAVGDLNLGYRTSRFRGTEHSEEIILSTNLQLFPESITTLKERIDGFAADRHARQPREASAGSVFRNPPQSKAGELIDKAGLRGKRIGGAHISEKHANYIVNHGHATAEDVLQLINLAKEAVLRHFDMELELEIELIGEWEPDHAQ